MPRLARAKRAQQMRLVTRTAVIQNASQVRCVSRHCVMGLMPANGSVNGVNKGTDEGAGLPITINPATLGMCITRGHEGRF